MASLHRVSNWNPTVQRVADVVFVHGLGGHPFETWSSPAAGSWLQWLAEDSQELSVWTLGYDAAVSSWSGYAMSLIDRAVNCLAELQAHQIGRRPLFFVGHSMGGLLVKQMLRPSSSSAPDFADIAISTRGVILLATPNAGTGVASLANLLQQVLRTTAPMRDLEANSPLLRDLNQWYRNNADALDIRTRVFF